MLEILSRLREIFLPLGASDAIKDKAIDAVIESPVKYNHDIKAYTFQVSIDGTTIDVAVFSGKDGSNWTMTHETEEGDHKKANISELKQGDVITTMVVAADFDNLSPRSHLGPIVRHRQGYQLALNGTVDLGYSCNHLL